jgi:uncharacterized paraquat-inducible protein A
MTAHAISCGGCSWPVPVEGWNRGEDVRCPGCGQKVQVEIFPAIARPTAGALPEAIGAETEASCFYHHESRAAVPCDQCGRFLCRLCDLEIDGRHLCTTCYQSGVSTGKLETLETRRTMYDSVALALATFPALLLSPAVFGAPAALYVVLRRWRAPGSVVPRTRIRFYLAAVLALAEIVGIVVIVWTLVKMPRR